MFSFSRKKKANYDCVSPFDFHKLIDQGGIILDVRTPEELKEGFVPDSVQFNFFDLTFRPNIKKLKRSKTYLVYCRTGNRSKRVCDIMNEMGFNNVYDLKGGILAWNSYIITL